MARTVTESLSAPGFTADANPKALRRSLAVAKAYELLGMVSEAEDVESVTLTVERVRDGHTERLALKW